MTAITSYTTLLTALATWNKRSDLTTLYPQFIGLAEAHFNRTLRCPEMETTVTQSISTRTVALPSDFLGMRTLYIDADTDIVLEPLTPQALRSAYPTNTSGTPVAYTVTDSNIVIGPTPSGTFTLGMDYYAKLDALSESTATNWLLDSHPDLYLRAVKFYSLEYLRDYEAADREMAFVTATIESLNQNSNRKRIPANPLASKPWVRE